MHCIALSFAGPKFLSDEEVTQVGDLNWRQSHATHDLYQAIENKDYPEWELSVQVMSLHMTSLHACHADSSGCIPRCTQQV